MLGQHIYMRCLVGHYQQDNQINPGSRTAAISEGMLSQSEVLSQLEARCNLDESFANAQRLLNSGKTVLRIYHLRSRQDGKNKDRLVVSRSAWTNDLLTDGRQCVYTFNHIVTDEHIPKLFKNPGALFKPDRFEAYASCCERIRASQNKRLTIDMQYSRLSPGEMRPNLRIFKDCGFSGKTFRLYMNGIFQSLEARDPKPLAVILPKKILSAWSGGYDPIEQLIYATYMLLPSFVRIRLGCTSHWSCDVMRSQRDTAHLVFVHPQNARDKADLMNSGAFVLDMESDSCVGIQGNRYAFTDHLFNVIGHDGDSEDLAKLDTAFAELLGRRFLGAAPSLEMCNALYLIYKAGKGATGSKTDVLNAISGSAHVLAKAASSLPAVDDFYKAAIGKIGGSDTPNLPKEIDQPLMTLLIRPEPPLRCYEALYRIVFWRALLADNPPEVFKNLCEEADRRPESAAILQLMLQNWHDNLPAPENISLQMVRMIISAHQYVTRHPEICEHAEKLIQKLTPILRRAGAWEKLEPIALYRVEQMKKQDVPEKEYADLCRLLMDCNLRIKEETSKQIEDCLRREEKRILAENSTKLDLFITSFLDVQNRKLDQNEKPFAVDVERLLRLACCKNREHTPALAELYQRIREKQASLGMESQIKQWNTTLLSGMLSTSKLWEKSTVIRQIVAFLILDMKQLRGYVPMQEVIALLLSASLPETDYDVYQLVLQCLSCFAVKQQEQLYMLMRKCDFLVAFYVYADLSDSPYAVASDYYIEKSAPALVKALHCIGASGNDKGNNPQMKIYKRWLTEIMAKTGNDIVLWADILKGIISDVAALQALYPKTIQQAYQIISAIVQEKLLSYGPDNLCQTSAENVENLNSLITSLETQGLSHPEAHLVHLIVQIDEVVESKNIPALQSLCDACLQSDVFETGQKDFLKSRMLYHMKDTEDGQQRDGELHKVLAIQIGILDASQGAFSIEGYFRLLPLELRRTKKQEAALCLDLIPRTQNYRYEYAKKISRAAWDRLQSLALSHPDEAFAAEGKPDSMDARIGSLLKKAEEAERMPSALAEILRKRGLRQKAAFYSAGVFGQDDSFGLKDLFITLLSFFGSLLVGLVACVGLFWISRYSQIAALITMGILLLGIIAGFVLTFILRRKERRK